MQPHIALGKVYILLLLSKIHLLCRFDAPKLGGGWVKQRGKETHSWHSFSFFNFNLMCANVFDLIIIMAQCQPKENVYEEEYYVLVVANIVIVVIFIRNFPCSFFLKELKFHIFLFANSQCSFLYRCNCNSSKRYSRIHG